MSPVLVFGSIMVIGVVLGILGFILKGSGLAVLLLILGAFGIMTGSVGLKRYVEFQNQEKMREHQERERKIHGIAAPDGESGEEEEENESN